MVPMDGMHMRFALMLRVAWELYLSREKDVNFGTHHQQRRVLFPESSLELTTHLVHPPHGCDLGSQVGYRVGGLVSGSC